MSTDSHHTVSDMNRIFLKTRELALSLIKPKEGESLMGYWMGEESDFVRFTQGAIRQPGGVRQYELCLTLTNDQRRSSLDLTLSGDPTVDYERIRSSLDRLRAILPYLNPDPYLCDPPLDNETSDLSSAITTINSSSPELTSPELTSPELTADQALGHFLAYAEGLDVVGILASGQITRGFFSCQGVTRWFSSALHQIDWSVVHSEDRAVKCRWGGSRWDLDVIQKHLQHARDQLSALGRPVHTISPGEYRALFSPSAFSSLLETLSHWGGWSQIAHEEHRSPLSALRSGARSFSPLLTVDDLGDGISPSFQEQGHLRPCRHPLISSGRWGASLVSPRAALKYKIHSTGAIKSEQPQSLEVASGSLLSHQAFDALGTGVYLSNVWYLNFSDRAQACVTGSTRFATMWVEDGAPVAPLAVTRFDDCLYDVLGDRLEALTDARELLLSTSTYHRRSLSSVYIPSMLSSGLRFTL